MKTPNIKKHSLALLLMSTASISYANEKKVQHDAHEHGVAEMNVIWDKDDLNIEILSPAFNITGFEYQPANHEQEELIEKIEGVLNTPKELFAFTGADCKAVKTVIESPFEDHDEHEEHAKHDDHKDDHDDHKDDDHKDDEHAKHDDHKDDHDDHKDDDHDDHKDGEKHAEHDDDHKHDDHDDHESSVHSEYNLSYKFSCTNSKDEIGIATTQLFKQFPQMEKIKVQWLSATQQSSSLLTKNDDTITLK